MLRDYSEDELISDRFGPDEVQCPIRELLARAGGRWTLDVLIALSADVYHFADLERRIAGISRRMLTLTLRGLQRDGLISRSNDSTPGERVYYGLTKLGEELSVHIRALATWSQRNRFQIYAAREAFDTDHQAAIKNEMQSV